MTVRDDSILELEAKTSHAISLNFPQTSCASNHFWSTQSFLGAPKIPMLIAMFALLHHLSAIARRSGWKWASGSTKPLLLLVTLVCPPKPIGAVNHVPHMHGIAWRIQLLTPSQRCCTSAAPSAHLNEEEHSNQLSTRSPSSLSAVQAYPRRSVQLTSVNLADNWLLLACRNERDQTVARPLRPTPIDRGRSSGSQPGVTYTPCSSHLSAPGSPIRSRQAAALTTPPGQSDKCTAQSDRGYERTRSSLGLAGACRPFTSYE